MSDALNDVPSFTYPPVGVCVDRQNWMHVGVHSKLPSCIEWKPAEEATNFERLIQYSLSLVDYAGKVIGDRVSDILGADVLSDRRERVLRLVEETAELAQSENVEFQDIVRVILRTYSCPSGQPNLEAAGVLSCLAVYARVTGINLTTELLEEVKRMNQRDPDKFRDKQYAKFLDGVGLCPKGIKP